MTSLKQTILTTLAGAALMASLGCGKTYTECSPIARTPDGEIAITQEFKMDETFMRIEGHEKPPKLTKEGKAFLESGVSGYRYNLPDEEKVSMSEEALWKWDQQFGDFRCMNDVARVGLKPNGIWFNLVDLCTAAKLKEEGKLEDTLNYPDFYTQREKQILAQAGTTAAEIKKFMEEHEDGHVYALDTLIYCDGFGYVTTGYEYPQVAFVDYNEFYEQDISDNQTILFYAANNISPKRVKTYDNNIWDKNDIKNMEHAKVPEDFRKGIEFFMKKYDCKINGDDVAKYSKGDYTLSEISGFCKEAQGMRLAQ